MIWLFSYRYSSKRMLRLLLPLILLVFLAFVMFPIMFRRNQLQYGDTFLAFPEMSLNNSSQVDIGAIHSNSDRPAFEFQSQFMVLPPDLQLNSNFADITDPYRPEFDLPFYCMSIPFGTITYPLPRRITKSGSTTTVAYLTVCLDLVVASQKGAHFTNDSELHIISQGDTRFANVDVTTTSGMERAGRQGLVQSGLVDFVASGKLLEAAEHIYNHKYRGRLFSVFRHPVERMVSMKEYLAKATWERLYDPNLANMTMAQYITNKNPMNNPITRQLVNKQSKYVTLLPEDLILAKEILRRKCLVGLVDHLEESLFRFQQYFAWKGKDYKWDGKEISQSECRQLYLIGGRNRNPHETIEPESEVWGIIKHFNEYDVSLYGYIVELFHQQSVLFPSHY